MRVTEHKRRLSKRLKWGMLALLAVGMPGVGALFALGQAGAGLGALAAVVGSAIAMAVRGVGGTRELGTDARIEDGALHVGTERFDTFAFGHRLGGSAVLLGLEDGRELVVEMPAEAEDDVAAMLDALGVRAGERATEFTIDSPVHVSGRAGGGVRSCALFVIVVVPFILLALLGAFGAVGAQIAQYGFRMAHAAEFGVIALLTAIALAPWWASLKASSRRQLTLGSDGLRIPGIWRDRFIPLTRIDRIDGELLVLTDGGRLRLFSDPLSNEKRAIRNALVRRIREESEARREPPQRIDTSVLARGDRSRNQWRQQLEREAEREAGYREAGSKPDDFATIAADGTQPPDVRVGAAFATAATGDRDAIAKVRIAAQATADTDLQHALEEAAEGELATSRVRRAERKRR